MSWCISILISEETKEEALRVLIKATEEAKTNDNLFVKDKNIEGENAIACFGTPGDWWFKI